MPLRKENEPGLSPEISRLSAQLAKDPKSKLFIPLAEEYMKAGMADEAVMALEGGLKRNPSYMSARVLLGKAYLEKGDMQNARVQLEMVVKAVPDNIFANRKLGDIYCMEGKLGEALKAYKMVSILNPKDEEVSQFIGDLEKGVMPAALVQAVEEMKAAEAKKAEDAKKAEEAKAAAEAKRAADAKKFAEVKKAAEARNAAMLKLPSVPARAEGPEKTAGEQKKVEAAVAEKTVDAPPPMEMPGDAEGIGEKEEEIKGPKVIDLSDVEEESLAEDVSGLTGSAEAAKEEKPAFMEMPVPEMETLEQVKRSMQAELDEEPLMYTLDQPFEMPEMPEETGPAAFGADQPFETGEMPEMPREEGPFGFMEAAGEGETPFGEEAAEAKPAGGYTLDLGSAGGLGDIFNAYKGGQEESGAGTAEGVYEITEEPSGIDAGGFGFDVPPPFEDTPGPMFEDAPAEGPAEAPAKEAFETETLAELYISQGFYDRAITIYKNLLVERPEDMALRQKLEDLYLLASVSSAKAAEKTGKEPQARQEAYKPVDFGAFETEMSSPVEEAPATPKAAADPEAVRKLERLLENIRRKGNQ